MRYDQIIYYPPFERHSLLLQVTSGCSYNRCAFCNMYKTVDFEVIPLRQVIADLRDAAGYNPYTERVFLIGGEPLCLPFEQIREILIQIKKYLPYCACVSMYASIKNLRDKSVEQLQELHRLGLGFLYIGLESGSDHILALMKKGHTAAEAVQQLQKLNQAQIPFNSILIYGLGGTGTARENAQASARMLNQVRSANIIMMNLTVFPETELEKWCRDGSFVQATGRERIEELAYLLEALELSTPTGFSTSHVTNPVMVTGTLPYDKEKMLEGIYAMLGTGRESDLHGIVSVSDAAIER